MIADVAATFSWSTLLSATIGGILAIGGSIINGWVTRNAERKQKEQSSYKNRRVYQAAILNIDLQLKHFVDSGKDMSHIRPLCRNYNEYRVLAKNHALLLAMDNSEVGRVLACDMVLQTAIEPIDNIFQMFETKLNEIDDETGTILLEHVAALRKYVPQLREQLKIAIDQLAVFNAT